MHRFLSPTAITLPSPCIPGTRVTVISRIIDWLTDESRASNVLWLYGPIGSGKSAVARTIWDRSEELGLPCSYISATENSQLPFPLFQIAQCFRDSWDEYWEMIVQNDCLLDPVLKLDRSISSFTPEPSAKYPRHHLVILDGLEPRHLPLISLIVPQRHRPSPNPRILWMICSRSFLEFRESLTATWKNKYIWLSVLGAGEEENEHDFKTFLEDGLKKLDEAFPTSSETISSDKAWPPPGAVARLVQETSGSFLYADRLLRFMKEKSVTSLQARLRALLNALDNPRDDVPMCDALRDIYGSIVNNIPRLIRYHLITVVITQSTKVAPLSTTQLGVLLGESKHDVVEAMRTLFPLLTLAPVAGVSSDALRIAYRQPLMSFLRSSGPSNGRVYSFIARRCLAIFSDRKAVQNQAYWRISKNVYARNPKIFLETLHALFSFTIANLWIYLCKTHCYLEPVQLVDSVLKEVLDVLRYDSSKIPVLSFAQFLYWLQPTYKRFIRSEAKSPEDQALIGACKGVAQLLTFPRFFTENFFEEHLKYPRYILLGYTARPFLVILTGEAVTVYSIHDIDEL